MVKNEQDIIEPFLAVNSKFFDAMIVADNSSSDATREIIISCSKEVKNIIFCDNITSGYTQSEFMTRMLESCQSAFFADYVMFLDADEFISVKDRNALELLLKEIPKGGVGYIPWQTFVVAPSEENTNFKDAPNSFRWRRITENPQFYKAILRLDSDCAQNITVMQGNHDVRINKQVPKGVILNECQLLHFPVRSGAQLASKAVIGWMAYLAKNPNARLQNEGFQWRENFDRVANNGRKSLVDGIAEASVLYAQSKITADWRSNIIPSRPDLVYERKHSTGSFADPLALLARSWERTLQARAPLVQLYRPTLNEKASSLGETSFDANWHWDHLYFDIPPFRYIAEKYNPDSILDIGCGIGQYLALFKSLGSRSVFGIDGIPVEATRGVLGQNEFLSSDLISEFSLGRKFDCVVCVEVIEHLPETASSTLLNNIERHATNFIVFSAAEPAQPGHGHINCRPLCHWLDRWAEKGWIPDLTDSLGMRALSTMSWFRRNLVVLKRGTPTEGAGAIEFLTEISSRNFIWYGQAPSTVEYPFESVIVEPNKGYAKVPT